MGLVFAFTASRYFYQELENMDYKSYINIDSMGYNWLAGITLLPATSVDISLLKNYLRKKQSSFCMLMLVGRKAVQQDT
jgi:hypothetical protein